MVYTIITPVKDEESLLPGLIGAVLCQSVLPVEWIIVDDGSTDRTPECLSALASRHRWVRVVRVEGDRARRAGGETALSSQMKLVDWEHSGFLARIDADISFGPDFFAVLLDKFREIPDLGIASGVIFERHGGQWVRQGSLQFHTRGASKIYRKECYEAIRPIAGCLGWDGQDEVRANFHGWKTRSFPDAVLYHHRPFGAFSGRMGCLRNMGIAAHYIGYHPLFFVARSVAAMTRFPPVLGGLAMLWGWGWSQVRKLPREEDERVIAFLRQNQMNRLLGRDTFWR